MTMTKRDQTKRRRNRSTSALVQPAPATFMDHVRELQGRLFVIAVVFLVGAAAAYPFFDKIVDLIVSPLGKEHELVYLTPGGAFSFIIQVCLYVGAIAALPMLIYQLYRFIMPAVKRVTMHRAIGFTLASFFLAIVGIVFAYVVSLPAALYFLTSFDLYHINPMLTIDSYFSFVMTYILAGAILFQLPLVMIMIDSIRPQPPKRLMKFQQHIIVGSFIVAAIISPTPDALNQTLLASPMVVMYQLGILVIAWRHRLAKKHKKRQLEIEETLLQPIPSDLLIDQKPETSSVKSSPVNDTLSTPTVRPIRSMDGFVITRNPRSQPRKLVVAERAVAGLSTPRSAARMSRSLDGLSITPRH